MKKVPGATRDAIMAAAATAFAARGFSGTSVDSIASASGYNKAMIYYHFRSKKGLYLEILRDVLRHMGSRAGEIAAADLPPAAKIEAFIDAFDETAASRPYMPPIMMREMAEGAVRLDADTLRLMTVIFRNLSGILAEGAAMGVFRPAHPVLTYFSLVSPIIFFRASAPVRAALARLPVPEIRTLDAASFVASVKATAITALTAGLPAGTPAKAGLPAEPLAKAGLPAEALAKAGAARKARRTRPSRPGDHA